MGGAPKTRKRIESRSEAARILGVTRSRLQEMERVQPEWWSSEFHDESGFDVIGIALAQQEYHLRREWERASKTDDDGNQLADRRAKAETEAAEESARVKRLERIKRERVEQEAAGRLVQTDIVVTLMREALGELRRLHDDFSWAFSQQVPPSLREYIYTREPEECRELSELAPHQRAVMKISETFQRWWDRIPEEIFEDSESGTDSTTNGD